ncbi:sporulation and spore germination protein [Asanoa ferruginea]|uniref:Sporulation and spore germination protein n=1 Tax=Asanoa ferruginea TaxID=53367 RepID=A0A3D9ZF06_9ACTN|nr:LpqB family beta-propeller domain-containing protein [Asanoa ferruginea]REF95042.1 sporulation and spore germination protein [Asanoa ferruginea]GIF48856.1 hypothetical protein Afe04nite_33950 [Asanoa ferruginea]
MRRRLAAAALAVGLSAGLMAGCGIPDHTEVEVEGVGPQSGSGPQPNIAPQPKKPIDATNTKEFVTNFLAAAAGEFDVKETTDRLEAYVAGGALGADPLKDGVTVVKVESLDTKNDRDFTLRVMKLGVLNNEGEILTLPEGAPKSATYRLTVVPDSAGIGWHLAEVPPGMPLLDVEALKTYYRERPVYFWNKEKTAMVPDLRWLPSEVGTSRVPTELLKMIAAGPSAIADVAMAVPGSSKLLGNALIDDEVLTMNWSSDATKDDYQELLAKQVAWTVRGTDLTPDKLILKINGQIVSEYDVESDLLEKTSYPIGAEVHPYAILDGKVRAIGSPAGTPGPDPLTGAADQNLRWAAFDRSGDALAAATVARDDKALLRVGTTAPGSAVSTVVAVQGIQPTSAPVWLPRSGLGLAVTDSGLWQFDATGKRRKIDSGEIPGKLTAVATAPDGQRLAVLAGGQVYFVPVSVVNGVVTLYGSRPLFTGLTSLTAVAWTAETRLSVGGTDPETAKHSIVDVTVDGGSQTPRINNVEAEIAMIAVYPENFPLGRDSVVLYQADNRSWMARGGLPTELGRSSLPGEPTNASPPPDEQSQPVSPFFVY